MACWEKVCHPCGWDHEAVLLEGCQSDRLLCCCQLLLVLQFSVGIHECQLGEGVPLHWVGDTAPGEHLTVDATVLRSCLGMRVTPCVVG